MSQAAAYNHYARWQAFARRWEEALETGYTRLDMAMIENATRAFAMPDYPPDLPMPRMTFDEAMQVLRLHQARVHGVGKRPGAWGKAPRRPDEVFASIAHKLDRIEKMHARQAADSAADRRALARGRRIAREE